METIQKVIRNGEVAVLISAGYGAGWYTWNTTHPNCLFSPEIVKLIEDGKRDEITDEMCKELFGVGFFSGGLGGLYIKWLPIGTHFDIEEYDGAESLKTFDDIKLIA